jgi:hypothetical protein
MPSGNEQRAKYYVYENYPNNKAVGHVETCRYFKAWGGAAEGTGHWYGPFDSKSKAEAVGLSLGRKTFHWCARCSN